MVTRSLRKVTFLAILFTLCLIFLSTCAFSDKPEQKDTIAPVPPADALSPNARAVAIGVSWAPSADNSTPQDELEYRVVCSSTGNIDTLPNALANLDENKSSPWMAGVTFGDAVNLSELTAYYLNVIVRDKTGNMAAYGMTSDTTVTDPAPPTLPNGNIISVLYITENSFTINWPEATDNTSPQNLLKYTIYYSLNDDVTDWTDISNGSTALALGPQTFTITPKTVGSVSNNSTYYLNVVATDERGNTTAYNRTTVQTGQWMPINCNSIVFDFSIPGEQNIRFVNIKFNFTGILIDYPLSTLRINIDAPGVYTDFTFTAVNGYLGSGAEYKFQDPMEDYAYDVSLIQTISTNEFRIMIRDIGTIDVWNALHDPTEHWIVTINNIPSTLNQFSLGYIRAYSPTANPTLVTGFMDPPPPGLQINDIHNCN